MLRATRSRALARAAPAALRFAARPLSTAPAQTDNALYAFAPSPLQEFSVVYTDRALNHMSEPFKMAMNDISETLRHVYNAKHAVVIPGGGSYAMEAVARQFATGRKAV